MNILGLKPPEEIKQEEREYSKLKFHLLVHGYFYGESLKQLRGSRLVKVEAYDLDHLAEMIEKGIPAVHVCFKDSNVHEIVIHQIIPG